MTRLAHVLLALLLLCSAAFAAEEADIAAAIKEKNGNGSGRIKIAGEWALADEVSVGETPVRTAQALMRKVNEHWIVSAELTGTGHATPEALLYHEVPEATIDKLLDGRTRDDMKSVLKLLRQMMPEQYPEGCLLENVVIADNWAICFYRHRAAVKRSDTFGQVLVRLTGGKWHLVEKSDKPVDLRQYGISMKLQRVLTGAP